MHLTLDALVSMTQEQLAQLRIAAGNACAVYEDGVLLGSVDLDRRLFCNLEGRPVLKLTPQPGPRLPW